MFPFLFLLIQYIFLWIVEDFLFEYLERTLAALPVGAINTERLPMLGNDFTSDEIKVVFPVPAYPFKTKTLLLPRVVINSTNSCIAFFWSLFRVWEKLVFNLVKLNRKKCENMALKAKELHRYDACAEVRKVCNSLLKWKIK